MDSTLDANNAALLDGDPFATAAFNLPASNTTTPQPSSRPAPSSSSAFPLISPNPTTPAHLPFNPDDFLVSPPHATSANAISHLTRATPDLKRRLFVPSDSLPTPTSSAATPSAAQTTSAAAVNTSRLPPVALPPSALPFTQGSDELVSPSISISFSPPRPFLSDMLPSAELNTRLDVSPDKLPSQLPSLAKTTPSSTESPPEAPTPAAKLPLLDPTTPATIEPPQKKASSDVIPRPKINPIVTPNPIASLALTTPLGTQIPTTPFTPAPPTQTRTRCSCKASRCLKLYCLCFAASTMCDDRCACKNCHNNLSHISDVRTARDTVLARDPRAFAPKVRNTSTTNAPTNTSAPFAASASTNTSSATGRSSALAPSQEIHVKGCNCRKGCLKKYCVCRELKVECGPRCTCSGPNGCLNGRSNFADVVARPRTPSGSFTTEGAVRIRSSKKSTKKRPRADEAATPNFGPQSKVGGGKGEGRQNANLPSEVVSITSAPPWTNKRARCDDTSPTTLAAPLQGATLSMAAFEKGIGKADPTQTSKTAMPATKRPTSIRLSWTPGAPADDEDIKGQGDGLGSGNGSSGGTAASGSGSRSRVVLYGRETEHIEVNRLPRILRVKMGSGKLLRRFNV